MTTTTTTAQIANITVIDWEAEEYMDGAAQKVLAGYGITAASNDDDMNEMAEWIDEGALKCNIRLSGTRQWLEDQHDELVSWANGVGRL